MTVAPLSLRDGLVPILRVVQYDKAGTEAGMQQIVYNEALWPDLPARMDHALLNSSGFVSQDREWSVVWTDWRAS